MGRMHPNTRGVLGNIIRAVAVTLAMSVGVGGSAFAMAVLWIGMKAITTIAEGLAEAIILRASSSPFSFPLSSPTMTWGTKFKPACCTAFSEVA